MDDSPALQAARRLHREHVVADLHVDTLLSHELVGYDMTKRHRNPLPLSPFFFQSDLPRAKDAGLNIWGMGLVTAAVGTGRRLYARILRELEYLNRVCEDAPGIRIARTRGDLADAIAAGAAAAIPGIEGAHGIGDDLARVRDLHELGMRSFTLAHFSSNAACACAKGFGARARRSEGLTDFGRRLVDEIHRLGLMLDLAHINKAGFMEACARSERPVFVSHTGVCGVHDHWRNIDDEQIEAVARTGGVVGIIFSPQFLAGRHLAGMDAIVAHIRHVVRVGGIDCVAYGSDMDGWLLTMPRGIRDVTDLPKVTAALLDSGFSESDVIKIIGANARRVLDAVLA